MLGLSDKKQDGRLPQPLEARLGHDGAPHKPVPRVKRVFKGRLPHVLGIVPLIFMASGKEK